MRLCTLFARPIFSMIVFGFEDGEEDFGALYWFTTSLRRRDRWVGGERSFEAISLGGVLVVDVSQKM